MAEVRWRGSAAAEPGLGGQRPGMRIRCNQTTAGKIVPAKSVQSDITATACCFSQENECVPPGSVKSAEPLASPQQRPAEARSETLDIGSLKLLVSWQRKGIHNAIGMGGHGLEAPNVALVSGAPPADRNEEREG